MSIPTIGGGANIVRDGLVFYMDVENSDSYSTSSATWYDLSRYEYDATLYNSPSYTSTTPKNLYFPGTNEYGGIGTYLPIEGSSTATFCYWAYCTVNATQFLLTRYNTFTIPRRADYLGLAGGTTNLSPRLYLGDTTTFGYWTTNTEAFSLNAWQHVTFSVNLTTPTVACYVNGVSVPLTLVGTAPASIISSPVGQIWRIAASTGAGGIVTYANIRIASLTLYNTALSAYDILQNYNATRTRFGL